MAHDRLVGWDRGILGSSAASDSGGGRVDGENQAWSEPVGAEVRARQSPELDFELQD